MQTSNGVSSDAADEKASGEHTGQGGQGQALGPHDLGSPCGYWGSNAWGAGLKKGRDREAGQAPQGRAGPLWRELVETLPFVGRGV